MAGNECRFTTFFNLIELQIIEKETATVPIATVGQDITPHCQQGSCSAEL